MLAFDRSPRTPTLAPALVDFCKLLELFLADKVDPQAIDRAGAKSAAQFLGIGPEQMTLEGTIYPHFKGGLRQVELMRAVAGLGQPMILVDGLGWVLDRWCIEGIEEKKGTFLADGAPRRIDFRLDLVSYGGDLPWLSI